MTRNGGKVHVVRVRKTGYVDKQGRRKDYSSAYLRRTYRDGGTVKNETVANLSALPDHVIDLIDAGLKGQQLVPAAEAVTITASLPHGHVAAAHAMARELGLPALLGPARPAPGPGPGADHLPGRQAGLQAVHPGPGGPTPPWAPTSAWPGRPPMTSTPRWTGWKTGRTRSRRSWPAATWRRSRTRRGWRCSTCRARGWRAGAARWPRAGTPGTARRAGCRSSTGCSPTPKAARSRSGCSPATPATPPRSPRSWRWCGTSSGWPRWSWSATAG